MPSWFDARRWQSVDAARGALLALYPAALTLLATYPGRRAVSQHEGLFGCAPWQFVVGGLCADLAFVLPVIAATLSLVWLVRAAVRRLDDVSGGRAGGAVPALVTLISAVTLWLYSVGASEYKLQQGLYPTLRDVAASLSDRAPALPVLPTIMAERFWLPSLICLAASLALLASLARGAPAGHRLSGTFLVGFFSAVLLFASVGRTAVWLCPRLLPSVSDSDVLYPPLASLAPELTLSSALGGARGVLEAQAPDRALAAAGARALGFGAAQAEALLAYEGTNDGSCAGHPLARDLPGAAAGRPQGSGWTRLVESFSALSRTLFATPRGPIRVLHVAVESFRADDVSALNPAALPAVAPFMSSLYAPNHASGHASDCASGRASDYSSGHASDYASARVIAFPHAYQSGVQTAHALSGLLCGLGATPYGIAMSRDLGSLPLRCLPDVLADAGFATRVVYGSNLSFDHMLEFFRYHGVTPMQKADFPWNAPKGAWNSVTDRAVYDAALDELQRSEGHQYTFVLTTTSHLPFDAPEDMPRAVKARLENALGAAKMVLDDDAHRRLLTLAYADWALARLAQRIEAAPDGAQTILLVSADHSTADPFVWRSVPDVGAMARVPLFVIVPSRFLMASAAPEAALRRLSDARALAAETPISVNDIPMLLLALLSASEPLSSLPVAWRWHTMGGMVTSPDYALPGRPASALWGVDASTRLFSVDRGSPAPTALLEPSPAFRGAGDVKETGEIGRSVSVFLASFLRGYARQCAASEHIRLGRGAARSRQR